MDSFEILLEGALSDYERTRFRGQVAIILLDLPDAQYLLTSDPKMVKIEDLHTDPRVPGKKKPSYIAVQEIGRFRPAKTTSLPYRHMMKQTGVMQQAPGKGVGPEYKRKKRHFGNAMVRLQYLDDMSAGEIERPIGTRVPLLTKVSKERGQDIPGRPAEPRKRRRGKRGGKKHRPPEQQPPQQPPE